MPLRINNSDITNLFVNGAEFKALHIDNTGRFGKRFSLTPNTSSGVNFMINRTSSPNQQAGTGYISTGNTIYYGDQITITVSPQTNYINTRLYVDIGDGQGSVQRTSPFSFTVSANVTYYGTATYVPPSASWYTVISNYEMVDWNSYEEASMGGGRTETSWSENLFTPGIPTRISLRIVRAWLGRGISIEEELNSIYEAEPPFSLQSPLGPNDFVSVDVNGNVHTTQIAEYSDNYNNGAIVWATIIDKIEQYY